MSCPDTARLAAAASGEDALAHLHATSCSRCSEELDAMTEIVALARRTRVRMPDDRKRQELAAELLARAELADVAAGSDEPGAENTRWLGTRARVAVVAAVALAATVLLALGGGRDPIELPSLAAPEGEAATPDRAVARVEPAPLRLELADTSADDLFATVTAPAGTIYRRRGNAIELVDGVAAIDARNGARAVVAMRGARVAVAGAQAEIAARGGAIESVRVFAGSVDVSSAGASIVVVAGDVWNAPDDPRDTSARAFRDGWLALRAHRDGDAVAAFDRATDPAVAEDAAYWATVASERLGDRAGTARRLRDFIARFPASPRIGAARAALDRVAP